jgi:hypothetical protein
MLDYPWLKGYKHTSLFCQSVKKLCNAVPGIGLQWKKSMETFCRFCLMVTSGNTNWGGRLSTIDLLIKVARFVKKSRLFWIQKRADRNLLVQGGQLYWAFPSVRLPWSHTTTVTKVVQFITIVYKCNIYKYSHLLHVYAYFYKYALTHTHTHT